MSGSALADRLTNMMKTTSGRNQVMVIIQYCPSILAIPLGASADTLDSLGKLKGMCGTYRTVYRLQQLWDQILGRAACSTATIGAGYGSSPGVGMEKVFAELQWVCDVIYAWFEGEWIFMEHGIIHRRVNDKRKAEIADKNIFFFFYGLVFGMLKNLLEMLRARRLADGPEKEKQIAAVKSEFMSNFVWFPMALAFLPSDGSKYQLLPNPVTSVFRPLHRLMEALTVQTPIPASLRGPWVLCMMGLFANTVGLRSEWKKAAP